VSPGDGQTGGDMRVVKLTRKGSGVTADPTAAPACPAHESEADHAAKTTTAKWEHVLRLKVIVQLFLDFIELEVISGDQSGRVPAAFPLVAVAAEMEPVFLGSMEVQTRQPAMQFDTAAPMGSARMRPIDAMIHEMTSLASGRMIYFGTWILANRWVFSAINRCESTCR
jgi:hypothetical protein